MGGGRYIVVVCDALVSDFVSVASIVGAGFFSVPALVSESSNNIHVAVMDVCVLYAGFSVGAAAVTRVERETPVARERNTS